MVNNLKPSIMLAKSSIVDVCQGFNYPSEILEIREI